LLLGYAVIRLPHDRISDGHPVEGPSTSTRAHRQHHRRGRKRCARPLPAWQATRTDLVFAEGCGWRGAREGRTPRGRSLLVCVQVALALMLVTVTVFMYRAFFRQYSSSFRTRV
jgi:hypothetical protein